MSASGVRFGLLLRLLIAASAVAAIGFARAASSHSLSAIDVDTVGVWVPVVELLILVAALICIAHPDSHLGVAVMILIGIEWLAIVDEPTTPWAIGAAVSVAVLHMALAAASVAPLRARWTRAMRTRWARRFGALTATVLPTWFVVVLLDSIEVGASSLLLSAAFLILAAAGLWVRHGGFDRLPPS